MYRCLFGWLLIGVVWLGFPNSSPAPLVFRPGEGWSYEKVGSDGKWQRGRAKDQLDLAQQAFVAKDYDLAQKAARRTVRQWPFSDYAPEAQYILGRCYEAEGKDQIAFKHYQTLLEKYPKFTNSHEVIERQFEIANRFLGGQWFRLWGMVPVPASKDKIVEMYEKVIKNAPYSPVAPQAQMNIGATREKQKEFPAAVKAYERAADRYSDQENVAAQAYFKAGEAYQKQAKTAEYDQNASSQAISTFTDFSALYPKDQRVTEAQKKISDLKTEQARGSFEIARFYEKQRKWDAAVIYYNDAYIKDPASSYAEQARRRITAIKKRLDQP